MACGATLKRTMDFDPLMSPTSPKRRRCIPVSPSSSSSSPRKYLSMEPSPFGESSSTLSAGNGKNAAQVGLLCWPARGLRGISNTLYRIVRNRKHIYVSTIRFSSDSRHHSGCLSSLMDLCLFFLSFVPLEQILNSIKQEYKRIQKRKHLDGGYQQSECCYSPESPSQPSTMNVSSMPGWLSNTLPTEETAPERLWRLLRYNQ